MQDGYLRQKKKTERKSPKKVTKIKNQKTKKWDEQNKYVQKKLINFVFLF